MSADRIRHRIVFVCTGNLCRSPMAEYQYKHMMKQVGMTIASVGSSGVIAQTGEMSPEAALAVMEEHGIDMREHRSKRLTQEMVDWSSHLIVMEDYHRRLVSRYFERTNGKLNLLSVYAPDGMVPPDIKDPYGELKQYYRKTYNEIRRCIQGLFARTSDV